MSFSVCQIKKSQHKIPAGLLQPLEIPGEKRQDVAIDFITKLARIRSGNDSILTVLDSATRFAHLIPCTKSISAVETAQLYWCNVAILHGTPQNILSDRDVRFTSRFWKSLWEILGTRLRMGTSYHPQTSNRVERMNQTCEHVLRCLIKDMNLDIWNTLLPSVQFVMNSMPSVSTGYYHFI